MIHKTISFTGHREYPNHTFVDNALFDIIKRSILNDYNHFISGLAVGIDQRAIDILQWVSHYTNRPIEITGVIPFPQQAKYWDEVYRAKYSWLIHNICTYTHTIAPHYTNNAYYLRDVWMVDNSNALIAVYDGRLKGGTAITYNYALSVGTPVYRIDPKTKSIGWSSL